MLVLFFAAATAFAAKYVDPLNGDDSGSGSISAPWKTLNKINLLSDTVYISNSAPCYIGGTDRNPSNVTLASWGAAAPTIYLTNSGGTALLYMNSATLTSVLRMVNIKIVADTNFSGIFIYSRAGAGKAVEIDNCEFDWSACTSQVSRVIHLRSTGVFFRFYSNFVHDVTLSSGAFINNEEFPYVCDVRYNRFYDLKGANPGIMAASAPNCSGIIANNTAWGANYLMWYNQVGDCLLTNVNNIVEYAKYTIGKNWFRSSSTNGRSFCDFNFSGDSSTATFDSITAQGPSNRTGLTEAQIAFKNTNDITSPYFLKIDISSVAAFSPAAGIYPTLNLPGYAGWAVPVPEPGSAAAAICLLICGLHSRHRNNQPRAGTARP